MAHYPPLQGTELDSPDNLLDSIKRHVNLEMASLAVEQASARRAVAKLLKSPKVVKRMMELINDENSKTVIATLQLLAKIATPEVRITQHLAGPDGEGGGGDIVLHIPRPGKRRKVRNVTPRNANGACPS